MKRMLLFIATLQFLLINNYCAADGFGWRLTEINYQAFESFFENATPERRKEVAVELNNYFLEWVVSENKMPLYKRIIDQIFTSRVNYDRLSFEEAKALDVIVISLFSPESPLTEFETDPLGFYVPEYCMRDIINASGKQGEVLHLFKKGRRLGSQNAIECDRKSIDLKKITGDLEDKKLTSDQAKELNTIAATAVENEEPPCYYSYIVLSPSEVIRLVSELDSIKKEIDFSYDDECFFSAFYDATNKVAKNKNGLFFYTTD